MAEILGVVAAAAQLATYATSLGDAIIRIKSSRVAIAEYRRSLDQLRTIARSVERNPLLQTTEVEKVTKGMINTFLESPACKVLFNVPKNRAIRAISAISVVFYQKQIEELFRSIEHEKSSLAIFIAEIQSFHIHEIRSDMQSMPRLPPSSPPSGTWTAPSTPRTATRSDYMNGAFAYRNPSYVERAWEPAHGPLQAPSSRQQPAFFGYGNQYFGRGQLHENYYHAGAPLGGVVDRNLQERHPARWTGNHVQNYGSNVWGHRQSGPREWNAMPLEQLMANQRYTYNVREQPSCRDIENRASNTVLGVEFRDGAVVESISGTWEGNTLRANGDVVFGTSDIRS
ncbi:hypothetical protein DHEL01_v212411 [Diaporthe helianthi]|uniref:Uncharacterized protein n=1 Tax=Diaporthe helianthi TaxID=158607 RepID=A0A2P5HG33_DIAHE|nr:hypothetical protein DHEL01_v212411 [Diaporthe helianthi]